MTAAASPTSESAELAGRLRIALSRLAQILRASDSGTGVTPTRLATLAILETSGPIRVGSLAERIGISAPTMSRIVDCLHERDLIRRAPDPDDLRATRVSISAGGVALLEELRHRSTGRLADRIGRLDPDRLAVLTAALPVLEELTEPARSTPHMPSGQL
ncbi:MarR family winged helix-turn-helix transcriptional regulator [Pseudonocardia acidicola]|uniref:MarR family transcriptional regulator n=1 Tax=Pseudonocardia acidicola TaxID=2724939 RepID=A0ABX1S7P9_9PSEU|nr:MarR family transcriptional regulator [Pseudonocardia acidicola]NMH96274.1 MarR family transcriptional regulator [Pseudonocardia acidicola]